MIFHQIRCGGCLSYIVGCEESCAAAVIDPEASLLDKYMALTTRDGLRSALRNRHAHARRSFSGSRALAQKLGVPVVMHRMSPAPFVDMHVDDGELIALGKLRLSVMHTPGHTSDSMALVLDDRVFTGDTLLIGGPAAPTCRAAIRISCTKPVQQPVARSTR